MKSFSEMYVPVTKGMLIKHKDPHTALLVMFNVKFTAGSLLNHSATCLFNGMPDLFWSYSASSHEHRKSYTVSAPSNICL
jgi:hypothetical protein